ncbi:type II secretion system secretin GspD [Gluconacetobacter tumulisoli]|uniref:Type II secretion system secretin GspD n=1 Tax=Gluconacetobacter tumulisoli TaxID=1286189 RepID=A0A7W4K6V6_9PROT|nr:type II secretion system secretin GspD [Gluconacetobacter tumulisoli]MBB2201456.1 type II secretion system secretin GspD [Gluconacetobacter tumulisoli]
MIRLDFPRSLVPATALATLLLSGCSPSMPSVPPPLPGPRTITGATPRIDGPVGGSAPSAAAYAQMGRLTRTDSHAGTGGGGDVTLNFAGTDIRQATEEILGRVLGVNYTVDSAVKGTVTLHTVQPLRRDQLIPTLRVLLAGANASLVMQDGLYRVVANTAPGPGSGGAGSETAIPLRYANAENIAKVIAPVVQNGGHVAADPASNTLIISGDAATRATLVELVRSFDVDSLAGQSYLLLPVTNGTTTEMTEALQSALGLRHSSSGTTFGGATANPAPEGSSHDPVRIFAMPGIDSILVVAQQPRLIEDARRAFSVIEAGRRRTFRSWNIYYLQNDRANDVAYILQQAFTPDHVTATPTRTSQPSGGMTSGNRSGTFGNMSNSSGLGSSLSGSALSGGGMSTASGADGTSQTQSSSEQGQGGSQQSDGITNNPLLAGLGNFGQSASKEPQIRIIPDMQNNSVLVYGTQVEADTVSAMLHRIDIMPLQVRVDATIAEVTLNDNLKYGTQFFFKSGGINGILSNASQSLGSANLVSSQLSSSFPGFVIGGSSQGGAPFVIDALQAVTTVRVLSSPEVMVVDNQPASLMVGDLVPYLTGATTSVLTADSTITNSINYQPTGVILQVTPHVSNTGLVTLDISQQVSSVSTMTTTTSSSGSINSPTFSERQVTSRVAIEDGQTVGLAGLITDNTSRSNQGIPWLKDIPVIGLLGAQQTNQRTRTELLVLITPHVIHDQMQARAMTDDLRRNLAQAAGLAPELAATPATGSSDPQHRVLRAVGLHD